MNRQGFIGGSDLYSIMRGDWHDLWLVKTGRKQPDDLSHIFKVQLGSQTEQFNIDWFCRDTGHTVMAQQSEFEQTLRGVPFKGTVDALVFNEQGQMYLLECKHTSSNRRMSDMIESYMPQIQLYMHLSNMNKAHLSVIFGNEYDHAQIDRSAAYLSEIVDLSAAFWQHVVDDTEPDNPDAVRVDWSAVKIDDLKIRDASQDNQFTSLAYDYCMSMPEAKKHDVIKKELRSMIADDEREVFCDILAIKRDKRGACRITVTGGTDD
jgi:hypothetical protein